MVTTSLPWAPVKKKQQSPFFNSWFRKFWVVFKRQDHKILHTCHKLFMRQCSSGCVTKYQAIQREVWLQLVSTSRKKKKLWNVKVMSKYILFWKKWQNIVTQIWWNVEEMLQLVKPFGRAHNFVSGFVVDNMHCIDLGVMRQMSILWFDSLG